MKSAEAQQPHIQWVMGAVANYLMPETVVRCASRASLHCIAQRKFRLRDCVWMCAFPFAKRSGLRSCLVQMVSANHTAFCCLVVVPLAHFCSDIYEQMRHSFWCTRCQLSQHRGAYVGVLSAHTR